MDALVKPYARACGALVLVLYLAMAGMLPAHGATLFSGPASGYQDQLFGVAVVSPSDVWAVGYTCMRRASCGKPLSDLSAMEVGHCSGR